MAVFLALRYVKAMSINREGLDRELIMSALSPLALNLISRLETHAALDSTNRYLMNKAQEGWTSGAVCFAEQQTAGRGRQGRSWFTAPYSSLAYSLLWRFTGAPELLNGLSLATGIATARVLQALGIADVKLKWPNDLWWQQRKLGGILLESGGQPGDLYVVAGVGINLALEPAQSSAIDQPWVDINSIPNIKPLTRNQLAAALISELVETFSAFEINGFAQLTAEWVQFDGIVGLNVNLRLPNATVSGIAQGVDNSGALLLKTHDGQMQRYLGGEISLRVVR